MNKRKRVAWEKHRRKAKMLLNRKRAAKAGATPTRATAAATS